MERPYVYVMDGWSIDDSVWTNFSFSSMHGYSEYAAKFPID